MFCGCFLAGTDKTTIMNDKLRQPDRQDYNCEGKTTIGSGYYTCPRRCSRTAHVVRAGGLSGVTVTQHPLRLRILAH